MFRFALAVLWAAFLMGSAAAQQAAFPTAEGYGRFAIGGRGGAVCRVTTLADSGAGSLRDCLTRTEARTVVFRIGGTIVVNSTIKATGQLTVAGQTASGGGIQIRNGSTGNTAVQFVGNDIIVRHIRFSAGRNDALFFLGTRGIFDHVSARWSTDEAADLNYGKNGGADITIQWSFAVEPMRGTVAAPAAHAYCLFTGGGARVTVNHVLMQDCLLRAPNVAVLEQFDIVNSVVHNWSERSLDIYARFGPANVSAVGNWWQMGANSVRNNGNTPARINPGHVNGGVLASYYLYFDANRSWATPNDATPDANLVPFGERSRVFSTPAHPLSVTGVSGPEQAFRDVMQFAGAFPRDAADARIVNEARTCTGAVRANESGLAYPVLAQGTPYPDNDMDGMDDGWELALGVSDGNFDADGDGYTNLEEFLNELAGDQDASGNVIDRVGTGTGTIPAVNCGITLKGGG